MPALRTDGPPPTIVLTGVVSIEEAEPILEWLKAEPGIAVDASACTHLHTAVIQLFTVAGVRFTALPPDPFWVHFPPCSHG